MIIWGSKGRTTTKAKGNFYCPKCGTNRQYSHKKIGKYFTLYFIPLFRTKDIAEFIECSFCQTPFELSVLQHSSQNNNAVNQLLEAVQSEIEEGRALQFIYDGLTQNGATDEQANLVIATATEGKMKHCENCKFVYSANLDFCSNCGKKLSEVT